LHRGRLIFVEEVTTVTPFMRRTKGFIMKEY
jgi:hypothetical protein